MDPADRLSIWTARFVVYTPGNRWRTFSRRNDMFDSLHASQGAAQSERVDILHQAAHLRHRADPGSRWCAWARPESERVVAAAQVGEMVAKIDRNNGRSAACAPPAGADSAPQPPNPAPRGPCCLIAAPRPERRPCRACNRPCAPLVGAERW